jgi:hypothetical protein
VAPPFFSALAFAAAIDDHVDAHSWCALFPRTIDFDDVQARDARPASGGSGT